MFGCLLAGFYLLRIFDMAVATYVAVAIDVAVAGAAFLLWRAPGISAKPDAQSVPFGALPRWILLATALSGLTALGAEVVWTRLLSLLLGATVYTFSIILAVFLTGTVGRKRRGFILCRGASRRPRHRAGGLPGAAGGGDRLDRLHHGHSLPYWPVDPWLSLDPWFNFEMDLVRCVWAIFPATLLVGREFPAGARGRGAPGRGRGDGSRELSTPPIPRARSWARWRSACS